MNSLFTSEGLSEIQTRINNLSETTKPQWGKMNVSQMLKHCIAPMAAVNGKVEMTQKVGFMKKLIFKMFKPMMYNDKPWKQNMPTGKDFIITNTEGFSSEKTNLLSEMDDFYAQKNKETWEPHPVFGNFTTEQYGKMQYKHLDHHLRQFGV